MLQDLKSEALRPRHWERLMELTGKRFDMDPKSFTLGALFAMQLHNFAQVSALRPHLDSRCLPKRENTCLN